MKFVKRIAEMIAVDLVATDSVAVVGCEMA